MTPRPRSSCGATACVTRSRARMRNACGTFGTTTTTTTGRPLQAPVRPPVRSGAPGPCAWCDTPPAATATHLPRTDPRTARGRPSGGTCSRSRDADAATRPRSSSSVAPAWAPPPRCTPRATLWTTPSPVRIPPAPTPRSTASSSSSSPRSTTPVAGAARRSSPPPSAATTPPRPARKSDPSSRHRTRRRTPHRDGRSTGLLRTRHARERGFGSALGGGYVVEGVFASADAGVVLGLRRRDAPRSSAARLAELVPSARVRVARSLEETREWPRMIRDFVGVVDGWEAGGGTPVVIPTAGVVQYGNGVVYFRNSEARSGGSRRRVVSRQQHPNWLCDC